MATTSRAAEGHMGGQVPRVGEHVQHLVGHMRLPRLKLCCLLTGSPTGSPRSSTAPCSKGGSCFSATSSCFSATGWQRRYVYSQKECVSAKQYVGLDIPTVDRLLREWSGAGVEFYRSNLSVQRFLLPQGP